MKGTSSKYAVQIIKKAIRGELTTRQAAAKLNCTRQYVNKLKLKYGKAGKEAFVHGNKGKKRWKLSDEIKEKIIQLYREKYIGFNFKHFLEKLNEVEQIKVTYRPLYRILEEANIPSPKRHKKGGKITYILRVPGVKIMENLFKLMRRGIGGLEKLFRRQPCTEQLMIQPVVSLPCGLKKRRLCMDIT